MVCAQRCRLAFTALVAVAVAGCASWKETNGSTDPPVETLRSQPVQNKKRLVLDIEFAHLPLADHDLDRSPDIWQWVDETAIDPTARRRLRANGIRVGIVADEQQFRSQIAEASSQADVVEDFLSQASIASDVSRGQHRRPMRLGRRYELPLHQPIEGDHVALVRIGDETIGRTLSHAQYLLAMTATESNSLQQVNLQLRPEVQYGATRQKFVSSDSALRIDARRETWSLPELDVDVTASEGDLIVFAADMPVTGIAKQMFTGSASDGQTEQSILIIDVAQVPSPVDEL